MDFELIKCEAELLLPYLIEKRRDFHKYAEKGWLEMRTASIIARELKSMAYNPIIGKKLFCEESRMGVPDDFILNSHYEWAKENGGDIKYLPYTIGGFTGVMAELKCGEGPVIALRFDIDALGLNELNDKSHRPYNENFASINNDVMHACGHDGHAAIGLGVAKLLINHKEKINGTVKLIFQPAEEGVMGAKSMIDSGILDDVDYVFASHIVPKGNSDLQLAVLDKGCQTGLATTKFDIDFLGKSAHAGNNPQDGNNAMLSAASAVLNLHSIPRFGNIPTHINVGKLIAGSGRNVVCNNAHLEMEIRGATVEAKEYIEDYAIKILKSSAEMHGCKVKIKKTGEAPKIENSPELKKAVVEICNNLGIKAGFVKREIGGSEDFAYFSQKVISQGGQSLQFALPCQCTAANHSVNFDFDERVLVNGVLEFLAVCFFLFSLNESA